MTDDPSQPVQPEEPDQAEDAARPDVGAPPDGAQAQQRAANEATPGGASAWIFGAAIGVVVVGLIAAAWFAGKDEGKRDARSEGSAQVTRSAPASTPSAAATGAGQQLFAAKCSSCHALKDAGSEAAVGPNLDDLKPDATLVLDALKNGGTGSGTMPPLLYQGEQAQQVADYVVAVTGGG